MKPGWQRWRFDQMAQSINERVDDPSQAGVEYYVGLEHLDSDSLKIRRWGVPDDVSATKLMFEPGDIIFGRRRAYQRKLGVAEFRGIASAHSLVLRAKPAVVLPEFLPFFMQSDLFMERAQRISVGSLSPTINWKTLAKEEFALPPLEEQRRITRALVAANEMADAEASALQKLQIARCATINYLLDPSNRADKVRLDSVASMQNGRSFPSSGYQGAGFKLLRPGNLGVSGYFSWPKEKTVYLDPEWKYKATDFVVQPRDVVINLTAQSLEDGFMGRVCIAKDEDSCLLNQRIGRFVCDSERLIPEYLFRALQTSHFRQHAETHCEGTKVQHLFWSHLSKYQIYLPSVDEQQQIANTCMDIDDSISTLKKRLDSARAYRDRTLNEITVRRSG
jgi:type I restriction enzyme, S subunit